MAAAVRFALDDEILPIKVQHEMLTKKLKGHDGYYGITGTGPALAVLRNWVKRERGGAR